MKNESGNGKAVETQSNGSGNGSGNGKAVETKSKGSVSPPMFIVMITIHATWLQIMTCRPIAIAARRTQCFDENPARFLPRVENKWRQSRTSGDSREQVVARQSRTSGDIVENKWRQSRENKWCTDQWCAESVQGKRTASV